MTRFLVTLLAIGLCLPLGFADDVEDHAKTLKDTSYGGFWDRLKACEALAKVDNAKAVDALALGLASKEGSIREAAAIALSEMSDDGARTAIQTLLTRHRDPAVRAGAAWAIRLSGHEGAEQALIQALKDRMSPVRAQAARAIAAIKLTGAGDALLASLVDNRPDAATEKIRACTALGLKSAADKLVKLASASHPEIKGDALEALAQLAPDKLEPLIKRALRERKAEVKMGLLYGFLHLDAKVTFEPAKTLLKDADWRVRVCAIDVMVKIRKKEVISPMIAQMAKEKGRLRYDFAVALTNLTGKDMGFDAKIWERWWSAAGANFELPPPPKAVRAGSGYKPSGGGGGGSVAMFFGIPILSNYVVFSIDFSGSMKNELTKGPYAKKKATKIGVAFEQLENCLNGFAPIQTFSCINTSTEASEQKLRFVSPPPRLVPATRGNKHRIMVKIKDDWKKLEKIKRGRGDLYTALLEGTTKFRGTDTMVMVTDGNPTYGEFMKAENFVPEWVRFNKYRRIMVHTIMVGNDSKGRKLMAQLAEETAGIALDVSGSSDRKPRDRKPRKK